MSTIKLTCAHCDTEFEKNLGEYKRRLWKLPHGKFFCCRSCAAKHNKNNLSSGNVSNLVVQTGNQHGRKYDKKFSYYIQRMNKDHRFSKIPLEEKLAIEVEIKHLWNGKCCYTNMDIELRDPKGKTKTVNPFSIASIDRIDCSLPYQVGNLQWCSLGMNLARQTTDVAEFKSFVAHLLGHH